MIVDMAAVQGSSESTTTTFSSLPSNSAFSASLTSTSSSSTSFASSDPNPFEQQQQQLFEHIGIGMSAANNTGTLDGSGNNNGTTTVLSFATTPTTTVANAIAMLANSAIAAAATASTAAAADFVDQQQQQQQLPAQPVLDTWRVPPSLFAVFVVFYAAVFFSGLVGNVFVVAAIAINKSLRTATDWLISSLALADLLILIFCLPSTLLNNLLTEWQLGSFGCKLSVWVNSTTSCASIFTLVGVTGDRYLAICHPLKQLKMKNSMLHLYILGIWLLSGALASPNLWFYREILYDLLTGSEISAAAANHQLVAHLCVDTSENVLLFIIINLLIAFLVPIVIICVLYALIFRAVSRHTQKKLAVDNGARMRDERVKLRIAQMMFTVIVVFVLCWTPLYALYCYFFMAQDRESAFFQFASSVLRPIFQWLSLLSSSLNPLIYIAFSQKYRRAFQHLLLLPCRKRYQKFQRATRNTFRLSSAFSEKPSTIQLLSSHHVNGHLPLSNGASTSSILFVNNKMPRGSLDATLCHSLGQRKVSFFNWQQPSMAVQRRKMSEQVPNNRMHSVIVRQQMQQKLRQVQRDEVKKAATAAKQQKQVLQDGNKQKMTNKNSNNSSSSSSSSDTINNNETTPMMMRKRESSGADENKNANLQSAGRSGEKIVEQNAKCHALMEQQNGKNKNYGKIDDDDDVLPPTTNGSIAATTKVERSTIHGQPLDTILFTF